MNEKEIAELRRRFRPEKSCISRIRGGCINEKKELVSEFDQPLGMLPEQEAEELLALLKKTLSGKRGRTLTDIEFSTQQVLDSDEHRLLMALRDSKLTDEEAVRMFFEKVIASYRPEGTYLILLANDTYDVPYRAKDGETLEDYLDKNIFAEAKSETAEPDETDMQGFEKFLERYKATLPVEKSAVETLK